jgi:hypothetical protein
MHPKTRLHVEQLEARANPAYLTVYAGSVIYSADSMETNSVTVTGGGSSVTFSDPGGELLGIG